MRLKSCVLYAIDKDNKMLEYSKPTSKRANHIGSLHGMLPYHSKPLEV